MTAAAIKSIKAVYQRAKRWVLYATVIFSVVVFYVPALEPLRLKLLPAACAAAFAILMEILLSVEENSRAAHEVEYDNFVSAIPDILSLVRACFTNTSGA